MLHISNTSKKRRIVTIFSVNLDKYYKPQVILFPSESKNCCNLKSNTRSQHDRVYNNYAEDELLQKIVPLSQRGTHVHNTTEFIIISSK
jgi:hypothetical protein